MPGEPFILTLPPTDDGLLRIIGGEADHLVKVLRARPGFRITGFDGRGAGWLAEVASVRQGCVECRILETLAPETAGRLKVRVCVGVVKGQRMDWAVEKASECGVETFVPLLTDRSVVSPGRGKMERWRSISLASAKQSRRLFLMEIEEPVQLPDLLNTGLKGSPVWAMDNAPDALSIMKLSESIELPSGLTLLIGPEGGFSADEIANFRRLNIPLATLGSRPLRTETAVAVTLGVLTILVAAK